MKLYRDALYSIARVISDKKTFLAFAQVSTMTARIARDLRNEKEEEFNHIIFVRYPDDTGNYCDWFGKYTRGNISVRGTRLWFLPHAAKCIEEAGFFDEDIAEIEREIMMWDPTDPFPGDYMNARFENLDEYIEKFDGVESRYKDDTTTWIILLRKCIIDELKRVLEYCYANDVEFRWV